jgi:hypothetical protein
VIDGIFTPAQVGPYIFTVQPLTEPFSYLGTEAGKSMTERFGHACREQNGSSLARTPEMRLSRYACLTGVPAPKPPSEAEMKIATMDRDLCRSTFVPNHPQIVLPVVPQSEQTDPSGRCSMAAINTRLPHAPPAGHWSPTPSGPGTRCQGHPLFTPRPVDAGAVSSRGPLASATCC